MTWADLILFLVATIWGVSFTVVRDDLPHDSGSRMVNP